MSVFVANKRAQTNADTKQHPGVNTMLSCHVLSTTQTVTR